MADECKTGMENTIKKSLGQTDEKVQEGWSIFQGALSVQQDSESNKEFTAFHFGRVFRKGGAMSERGRGMTLSHDGNPSTLSQTHTA